MSLPLAFGTSLLDLDAHSFAYPNATARVNATGFSATDVGKLALQEDDLSLWMLTSAAPVAWRKIGDSLVEDNVSINTTRVWNAENFATVQFNAYNLTASNFTTASRMWVATLGVLMEYATGTGTGSNSAFRQLALLSNGARYTDTIGNLGINYAADYSANYTDRTLVDKGYVDNRPTYTVYMAGEIFGGGGGVPIAVGNNFSFGNGARTNAGSPAVFVPNGYTCTLEAIHFSADVASTMTFDVVKDGVLQGQTLNLSAQTQAGLTIFSPAITFNNGETINAQITGITAGPSRLCVTFVLRFTRN